jgi:outer membrane PBP1 activator LpoA protein
MTLRPLLAFSLAALLCACASDGRAPLGELPRTPKASIEQLLSEASSSQGEQAALLRLSAAEQALRLGHWQQTADILQQVPLDSLKPAQQIYASTLSAELDLARQRPKSALKAFAHPSFERLAELPLEQQLRSQSVRAQALEADKQLLAAARERVFIAPLLADQQQAANHAHIWKLLSQLSRQELQSEGDSEFDAWRQLALISKQNATPQQQSAQIDAWLAAHPQHPAAQDLPQALRDIQQLARQPLQKIALLLPQDGPLASVARALRDGFLAAHYQALASNPQLPSVQLYDSNSISSLDAFYQQASQDGIQLVVGPLEKPLVKQLSEREQLPLPTLALNYSDSTRTPPAQLFQFGLAAEDEARAAAQRAWDDGMRRAVALVPSGEWGRRVLAAFQGSWQAQGGELLGVQYIDQPVELARQIAELLQLRQSEARAQRLEAAVGSTIDAQPARRHDIDFIFLAATPQQAQQIKPTLAFQYAGDIPVYATSHLYSGTQNSTQLLDMDGIRFCETPWLLFADNSLQQQTSGQWPQASGSLGRLYAMGADAYQLTPRLQQLQSLPGMSLDGLSGRLSLAPGQRVQRQLPWAEIRDGQVVPLPGNDY